MKYLKESILMFLQLFMFYIFPLFAGPTDAMGMVFLIIVATFLLSALVGGISGNTVKYLYPFATAILFLPSIPLYYNFSALVHSLWYLVVSTAGFLIGWIIRKIFVR